MSGPPRNFGHVPYAEELQLANEAPRSEASWRSCLGWAFGVPAGGAVLAYLIVAIINGVN